MIMSRASGSHLQEFMNQMNGKISDTNLSTGTFGNGSEKISAVDLNCRSSGHRAGKQFDGFLTRAIIMIGVIGAIQQSKLFDKFGHMWAPTTRRDRQIVQKVSIS
jgi:hypothetical protein